MRGKTTLTLNLDELGTLRSWLDEGMTQISESEGPIDLEPEDNERLVPLLRLDSKLHRAVQRCYRNGDRAER